MYLENKIYFGKSGDEKICILPQMANRHGLIAGATGTGKTVTLKVLAESFSDAGVPVFMADVKGDLSGMTQAGLDNADMQERIAHFALTENGFAYKSYPANYWDVYGEKGMPLRTTITEMGPLLLGEILDLNDTQMDVLAVVFRIADDEGLLLIDTKDMRSMLQYVSKNVKEYSLKYGNIAQASLGAIQRSLMALEAQGADKFFGEPALSITDWLATDNTGRGMIQILDCQKLIRNPRMYSTFLLWMLSELFETLPEAGDMAKPRMIFFFDEAHLLFDMASPALLEKIGQVVKLIRSKGIGIYFITQNPSDIPDEVLGQLGNKIQHALHAYTPAEQKKVKAAAQSFRANPEFDTVEAIEQLGIGEALVSVLDEQGIPTIVKKTKILPPQSRMGTIDDNVRSGLIQSCMLYPKYMSMTDRDSAYEFLLRKDAEEADRLKKEAKEKERMKAEAAAEKQRLKEEQAAAKQALKEQQAAERQALREQEAARKAEEKKQKQMQSEMNKIGNTVAGTIGREIGNNVGRTVGGSFGRRLGGNLGASLGRGLMSTLFKQKN